MKEMLWACQELLKRYKPLTKVQVPYDTLVDSIAVIISEHAEWYQKKAARMILDYAFGKKKIDEMIESVAVITDRDDRLVLKWRKAVIKRDGCCVECGATKNLQAHHISEWSNDPINRINLSNGKTLCTDCHAKEHPELKNFILGGKNRVVVT